jgi:hypothetical protein
MRPVQLWKEDVAMMTPRSDRRGFALPAATGALVIMGILVTAGFYMSRQELRIGVASKHANMAVNIAQAGANEVMANWNGYQLGNLTLWGSATIVDTIASGIWTVNIHNSNNFVYHLTATGEVTEGGPLWAGATRTIGITTKILFANIDPPAALTTRGQVKISGNSEVNGTNYVPPTWGPYCSGMSTDDSPGVLLDDVTGTNPQVQGSAILAGTPPSAEDPGIVDSTFTNFGDMDWDELVAFAQIEGKDVTSVGSFNGIAPSVTAGRCNTAALLNWGDTVPTNPCGAYFPLIYHSGSLTIQSNSYGQGILLVEGDVQLRGGFTFFGIVITQGRFTSGLGGSTVYGAVMASNAIDLTQLIGGGGEIHYSRCAVTRAVLNNASLSRARPLDTRSWVDLTAAQN